MFLWRADTLVHALREHLPKTAAILDEIAATYGASKFDRTFRKLYPKCENISVDYAILEPRSAKGEDGARIFCLPSDFGWNDLGSWTALHEHHSAKRKQAGGSLLIAAGNFELNASNNYVHAPGKFVATVGVNNLVVVETEDALLITTLDQSQDVGKVVKYLDEKKLKKLVYAVRSFVVRSSQIRIACSGSRVRSEQTRLSQGEKRIRNDQTNDRHQIWNRWLARHYCRRLHIRKCPPRGGRNCVLRVKA